MYSGNHTQIAIANTYHSYTILLKEVIKKTRPELTNKVDVINLIRELKGDYQYIFFDADDIPEESIQSLYQLIENKESVFIIYSYFEENPLKINRDNVYYFSKDEPLQSIVNVVKTAFLKKTS